MLEKRQAVMHTDSRVVTYETKDGDSVEFAGVRFDTEENRMTPMCIMEHYMTVETWEDMGSPEMITLTVEPGDKLNG